MSEEIIKAEGTLNQNFTSNKAVGVDMLEGMWRTFEQFPQKYQMAFFSVSLLGLISLSAYVIHSGYSVTGNQDGWSLIKSSPSVS